MTRSHGRHLGLVRGGRSRRLRPVLQAGNGISATWRARLDEHLGTLIVEPMADRAARLMDSAGAVYGIQALAALVRLLPEREAHPRLYEQLAVILDAFEEPVLAASLVARFEVRPAGGSRLRPRPRRLRRHRLQRRSGVRLAAKRDGQSRAPQASPISSVCCRCRRSCGTRPRSIIPRCRTSRPPSVSPDTSSPATCSIRGALECPRRARRSSPGSSVSTPRRPRLERLGRGL